METNDREPARDDEPFAEGETYLVRDGLSTYLFQYPPDGENYFVWDGPECDLAFMR